jgi:signal peptide peptidase SppA
METDRYRHVLSLLFGNVWAIMPEKLNDIIACIKFRLAHGQLTASEIEARIGKPKSRVKAVKGDVAVMPVFGVLAHRMNMMTDISGGSSTEELGAQFAELANDPSIGAIVLDVDSPGGTIHGMAEMSAQIHAARNPDRPIIAVANDLMASAAYWIGSAADEIVIGPNAYVGSIGVIALHADESEFNKKLGFKYELISAGKYKTEGNPFEPLGDEAKAEAQRQVDLIYADFVKDVARNRGVKQSTVKGNVFGEGRVFTGLDAIERNMADRQGTLADTVSRLLGKGRAVESRAAMADFDILRMEA